MKGVLQRRIPITTRHKFVYTNSSWSIKLSRVFFLIVARGWYHKAAPTQKPASKVMVKCLFKGRRYIDLKGNYCKFLWAQTFFSFLETLDLKLTHCFNIAHWTRNFLSFQLLHWEGSLHFMLSSCYLEFPSFSNNCFIKASRTRIN